MWSSNAVRTAGGRADAPTTAKRSDEVGVVVTVAYSNVSVLPTAKYLSGKNLTGRCVLGHE